MKEVLNDLAKLRRRTFRTELITVEQSAERLVDEVVAGAEETAYAVDFATGDV